MRTRTILLGVVFLASLWLPGCASQGQNFKNEIPHVTWLSYHSALVTGESENKPTLLHFSTDWNEGSQKMERETYANYDVAGYMKANFSSGWIDTERHPGLAKKYKVSSLPTICFLDSQGKLLTSTNGFIGPKRLFMLLEFINTGAYEKLSFEAWKTRRVER